MRKYHKRIFAVFYVSSLH